jgi:hypothetical protein
MDAASLLVDAYGRIPEIVADAVEGLSLDELLEPPAEGANPIGWLAWHIARVEDHQTSPLLGLEQLWVLEDVGPRFGLASDPSNLGYGHGPAEVAAVRPESADALLGYLDAVSTRLVGRLGSLGAEELDRIVDERWDPPVSMGARLVSVLADCLEHAGQAAYLRGLLLRAT